MPIELTVKPQTWLIESITNAITTLIGIYLVKLEFSTLRSGNAVYTTKYLKLWSILCILCGPISGISYVCQSFDGPCFITWYTKVLFAWWDGVFMGMYQLSRLYYCFSRNQSHSGKGYPKYVFIFMFGLGALFLIQDIQLPFSGGIITKCGLNDNYEYTELKEFWYWLPQNHVIWLQVSLWILFLLWDFGTLFMYLWKIKSLKNNMEEVNQRVLAIMHRVVILTLFYEIPTLFFWWIFLLFGELQINVAIFYSISMYLMQQHNDKQYAKFTKIIHILKLHYLCCCYRHIIVNQVMDLNTNQEQEPTTNDVATKTNYDHTIDTKMNYENASNAHGYVEEEVTEFTAHTR